MELTPYASCSREFSASGAGITLEHCTVTEDGVRTALEFNAIRWGSVDMPPQAGVAVSPQRGRAGNIAEARIYDDVDPPIEEPVFPSREAR